MKARGDACEALSEGREVHRGPGVGCDGEGGIGRRRGALSLSLSLSFPRACSTSGRAWPRASRQMSPDPPPHQGLVISAPESGQLSGPSSAPSPLGVPACLPACLPACPPALPACLPPSALFASLRASLCSPPLTPCLGPPYTAPPHRRRILHHASSSAPSPSSPHCDRLARLPTRLNCSHMGKAQRSTGRELWPKKTAGQTGMQASWQRCWRRRWDKGLVE